MPQSPDSIAQDIALTERRIRVMELKREGRTFREIAKILAGGPGTPDTYCHQTAYLDYKVEIKRLIEKEAETASEARRLDLERLDALLAGIWGRAEKGDEAAIDRVLRILERRAKLTGADAPAKIAETDPEGKAIKTPRNLSDLTEDELAEARRLAQKAKGD